MPDDRDIPRIGRTEPPLHDTSFTSDLGELMRFADDHSIPRGAGIYAYRELPGGQREEWAVRDIKVELTSGEPDFSAIYLELIDYPPPSFGRD